MYRIIFILMASLYATVTYGQSGRDVNEPLEQLLKEKDYANVEKIAKRNIEKFSDLNENDSLFVYFFYDGISVIRQRGLQAGKARINHIIQNQLFKKNADPKDICYAYLLAANMYMQEGYGKDGYNLLSDMLKMPGIANKIASLRYRIENTMGYFTMRLGQYATSAIHYRQSIKLMPADIKKTSEYFTALNGMGTVMYYASKLDSAIYYDLKAQDFLQELDESPVNLYYRSGMLDANISNVYADKGETNKSFKYAESAIEKYRKFLAEDSAYPQKPATEMNLLFCMDNMAGTLLETGDFTKAKNLYTYALNEKRRLFGEVHPEVYDSYLALSGLSLSRDDPNAAIDYAQRALAIINKIGDSSTAYEAEVYSKLAQANASLENNEEALYYFEKANTILMVLNGETYSVQHLYLLNKYAKLKAIMNDRAGSEQLANTSLKYVLKSNPPASYPVGMEYLAQIKTYGELKEYKKARFYAEKAIGIFNLLINNAGSIVDSIRFENFKAMSVLGKGKAEYSSLTSKNKNNLQKILNDLKATTEMFERRKLYYTNYENINYAIASYKDINDFINLIQLDLYKITGDVQYIDSISARNESLVYTRLKKALYNRQLNLKFKNVPASVIQKEASILSALDDALQNDKPDKYGISAYYHLSAVFEEFLNMLKNKYPDYYNAKYGTIPHKKIRDIQHQIPAGSQVVRFYTVDNSVYALVLSPTERHWVNLPANNISNIVNHLQHTISFEQTGKYTYELYQQLWQPIEKFIHARRITIIPDGIIYSISFEMLTMKPVKNTKELLASSLLKKHAFSYQYSLDVLHQKPSPEEKFKGLAVFAPGFSENVKEEYKEAMKDDSIHIDHSYMTLLPLPFSRNFASKLQKDFKGSIYVGEKSTLDAFKNTAANHSIIYIGTHAEANNQYPEYSKILFAKNLENPQEDNSLYLYDIYNEDLSADLAVLTACETGRSNSFMGEGMVSMAHAFNYAGSRSILTGLWKIDERASVMILELFYKNLDKGMTKDVALQQAKISYLEGAQGRMAAPQYWAGLIIMGDISPIVIEKSGLPIHVWIGGMLLLAVTGFFGVRRMKHKKAV